MTQVTTTDGESTTETSTTKAALTGTSTRLRASVYALVVAGLGLAVNGGMIGYRALFQPGFEAGVDTLGGVSYAELAATNHEVAHYVDHLHVNVAGLLVAAGIGVAALAWFGVRRGRRWALGTAVAIPAVFLAHSLPVHHTAVFSYDTLAHLGPGFFWVPAVIVGAVLGALELRDPD